MKDETQGGRKLKQLFKDIVSNENFKKEAQQIREITDKKNQYKKVVKLGKKYSLDFSMFSPLMRYIQTGAFNIPENLDICIIVDEVDEYLNDLFPYEYTIPPSKRPEKVSEINMYPIKIGISHIASQRDIIDFIKKNWEDIQNLLHAYSKFDKSIKFRQKVERDDFIWEHRDLKSTEIANLVSKKFPSEETLTYDDINKILHKLKKRRQSQIV